MQVRKVKQVNEDFFLKKCKEYAEYIKWVDTEFPDTIEVAYEDLVLQSDKILADLTGYQNTFTKKFGEKLSTLLKNEYEYVNFGKCKNKSRGNIGNNRNYIKLILCQMINQTPCKLP